MGSIVDNMGKGINSLLKTLEQQRRTEDSYRKSARADEYQAAVVIQGAYDQNGYLLQSAAEKARQVYQNYLQNTANQRAQVAALGLSSQSATVQNILKNNRFQVLLDEQNIAVNLQNNVLENNIQAAQQVRALKELAATKRRAERKGLSGWKLGTTLFSWFGGD